MPGWAQGPRTLPDDGVLGASQGPLTSKTTLVCNAAQSIAPRRKTALTRTFSEMAGKAGMHVGLPLRPGAAGQSCGDRSSGPEPPRRTTER